MVKYILILFFVHIYFLGFNQIITDETTKSTPKKEKKEKKEKKLREKAGIEIYAGILPMYTFRTLTQTEGVFGKPLGYKIDEKGKWAVSYAVGARTILNKSLKLDIGVGYFENKESFDYTNTDSVYRYTNSYRNIGVPIKLGYSYGNKFKFYGAVGVIPKAFINMRHDETVLNNNGKEVSEKTVLNDNKFNLFLLDAVATLGTQIKLSPHFGIYVMGEGRRQLVSNFTKQQPHNRKPYAFGFHVGLEFYL